ncbi:hypothetical protein RIF29_40739 [Crotalaria pallida]|uniref:Protein kinase domain-containing protein n=1 Tax=Crotalaria pallida TaxID=3830 RepID=A0AAN9E494_CROPI
MDWVRGNTIGRGSTAAVYKAESRRSGKVFAVKSAELHRSEFLKREEEILSKMNCPQIVSYQGCDVTYENGVHYYNLCMEYARGGTLADAVRNGEVMDEALARRYTRQMLEGLKYLHANGIVHCDVKGQNVLLTDQGAKLADFGCAKRMGDVGATATAVAGTPAFMAPEVARGEQQGFPGDVWALGCTVLEMITGKPPWHGASDPAAVLFQVGFSGEIPEIPNSISKEGNDFLSKCFKSDPCERWTVSELLNHEFVRELNLVCDGFAFACDLESPRSVLGRGCIWESKTNEGLTRGSCSLDSPSPRDRIQSLCTSEPFWDWGDDDEKLEWVTVRSNDTDKEKLESIEKMENYGSDTVCNCILREDFDLYAQLPILPIKSSTPTFQEQADPTLSISTKVSIHQPM